MEPVVTGCLRTPHTTLPPPRPCGGDARLNGARAITKRWTRLCRSGIDEPSKESARTVKPRQRRHISQAGLRGERHTTTSAWHTRGSHTRPTFRKPAVVHRWSTPVEGGGGGGGGIPTPTLAGERGNRRAPEIPWPAAKRPTTLRLDCIPLHPKGLTCTYL